VPRLKFITICGSIRSLKSTHMQKVLYLTHTENFLFFYFVARKRNIFSRPDMAYLGM
jgi:hypothetical protein